MIGDCRRHVGGADYNLNVAPSLHHPAHCSAQRLGAELIDRVELRAYSLGVCLTAVNVCAAESHLASGIAESLNHSVGIGNRHHDTAAREFKLHDPLTVSGWRHAVGSASARLCGGIFFKFLFQIIVSHRVAVIRSHRSPRHVRRR